MPLLQSLAAFARDQVRRPIFWIVLSCFVLRLFFVLSDAPTPVQFDARIYVSSALALPVALAHPSLLFDKKARENISYDLVYADRLRGETVRWLYYDPPSFNEALERVFFSGPVYPALLGLLFWPDWANDFAAARVANVVFDTISCMLLFWILSMTAGRAAALIGAALFAVYPGFIIQCGELTLETPSACLALLAVALGVSAVCHDRPRRFFGAGLALALLLLTRAGSSVTIAFFGLAIILLCWQKWGLVWKRIAWTAAGYLLLTLPWVILIWINYGQPNVRDPQRSSANFRSSNVLANRGYDLDLARQDFWTYPVGREVLSHPGEYFLLYVEKFYRLWNRSYNDYRIPLLVGVPAQVWFHRLLILIGIVGLFFWPARKSRYAALFALALIADVSVVHTLWHSVTRYALVAMPLLIGSAAVGLEVLRNRFARRLSFSRGVAFGLAALVTYLCWDWVSVGQVLGVWGSLSPDVANFLVVAVRAVVLAGDLILVCGLLGGSRRTLWLFGVVLLAGQVILCVKSLPRERWAEWWTSLSDDSHAVERVIHFPPGYDWGKFQKVFVLMDIQSGGGEDFTFNLQLDTTTYSFARGTYSLSFYPKPSYKPFLEAYGVKPEQIRHWVTFALARDKAVALLEDDELLVRLWVTGGDRQKNYIRVYGEYRPDDWQDWVGPTVFNSSVERLYEEDDPRIWEVVPRELIGAENRRIEDKTSDAYDLSILPGLQTGDYRILIMGMIVPRHYVYF